MKYYEISWLAFQLTYAELLLELNPKLEPWEKPGSKAQVRDAWAPAFNMLPAVGKCDA